MTLSSMETNWAAPQCRGHQLCIVLTPSVAWTAHPHLHKTCDTSLPQYQASVLLFLRDIFSYKRQVTYSMLWQPFPFRRKTNSPHYCAEVMFAELTRWKKMPGSNHGLFISVRTAGTAPATPAPTTGTNASWWTSTIWAWIRTKLLQTLLFGPLIKAF